MSERIELHWTPEQADWVEAFRAVSWFYRWAWAIGTAAILVSVVLVVVDLDPSGGSVTLHTVDLVFALPGLLLLFITRLHVRSFFRRNPVVAAEKHGTVDATGLGVTAGQSESHYEWHAFAQWREMSRSFILRMGASSMTPVLVIPKRAVQEPADIDALRHAFARYLRGTDIRPEEDRPVDDGDREGVEFAWTPALGDMMETMRASLRGPWMFRVLGALLVVYGCYQLTQPSSWWSGVLLVPLGVLVGSVAEWTAWLLFRFNRLASKPMSARLDSDGVHLTNGTIRSVLGWHLIVKWRETSRSFVLRQRGNATPVVIPKRGAAGPAELDALRVALEAHRPTGEPAPRR